MRTSSRRSCGSRATSRPTSSCRASCGRRTRTTSCASSRRRRAGCARATPTFEVEGALRDRLLAIKRGEVSLDDVLAEAEAMAPELERARDASTLPKRPDVARADALLRGIGEELARRWVAGAPGPFGTRRARAAGGRMERVSRRASTMPDRRAARVMSARPRRGGGAARARRRLPERRARVRLPVARQRSRSQGDPRRARPPTSSASRPPPPTVDRAEIIDGVEIDYTSNELAHALAGILGGNGNFLERVLGRMTAHASPLLERAAPARPSGR